MHEPDLSRESCGDREAGYKSKLGSSNASRVSSKVGAVAQSIIAESKSGEDARRRDDVVEQTLCAGGAILLKLLSLLLV